MFTIKSYHLLSFVALFIKLSSATSIKSATEYSYIIMLLICYLLKPKLCMMSGNKEKSLIIKINYINIIEPAYKHKHYRHVECPTINKALSNSL